MDRSSGKCRMLLLGASTLAFPSPALVFLHILAAHVWGGIAAVLALKPMPIIVNSKSSTWG